MYARVTEDYELKQRKHSELSEQVYLNESLELQLKTRDTNKTYAWHQNV